MAKRVFLIVLDSFGVGAEPDAPQFGDAGTNTLGAIAGHPNFKGDNLAKLGMFNLDGVTCGTPVAEPIGSFARLREASAGKDHHRPLGDCRSAECRPATHLSERFSERPAGRFHCQDRLPGAVQQALFRH